MAHDILDLTLPAHDPNFPKPRGLLPVPPLVAQQVADEEARILRELSASDAARAEAAATG